MPRKIDPLNKKQYGAVNVALTVTNMKTAMEFYQKALGFKRRSFMKGPGGMPVHAELTLRDSTVMLGPEMPGWSKSAKTAGASPTTLYLYVEDVDKVFAKALKLGATQQMPVGDMFWGDRCGNLVDPEGYAWTIATHKSEPTAREMMKKMKEQMSQAPPKPESAAPAAF